jgi:hypothetical protein
MLDKIGKLQFILFSVAISVWILPETNFLKDLCFISGAIVSLFIIFYHRKYLFQKNIAPFVLLIVLLIWVIFHFIFFSEDHSLQLRELSSTWKRVLIATIFGLGLGLCFFHVKNREVVIKFLYFSISSPVVIFYLKFLIELIAIHLNIQIPDFLKIFDTRTSTHYIPKPEYLYFIFPALLWSIINIHNIFVSRYKLTKFELYNFLIIFLVFGIFYLMKIKSGFFYGALVLIITVVFFIKDAIVICKKKTLLAKSIYARNIRLLFILTSFSILGAVTLLHFKNNNTWHTFFSDLKVGIQVDRFEHWKNQDRQDNPINDQGTIVSKTTYDRVAWAIVGLRLVMENPHGHGVLENSFYHLAREKWPSARVPQTHNSWIDFGLAFGWLGIALLFFAFLLPIMNYFTDRNRRAVDPIEKYVIVILLSYMIILLTSEVNFKYALPITFFWIAFSSGVQVNISHAKSGYSK